MNVTFVEFPSIVQISSFVSLIHARRTLFRFHFMHLDQINPIG